jgi:hypothetical protein
VRSILPDAKSALKPMSPETSLPSFLPSFLTPHRCLAPRQDRGPGVPVSSLSTFRGGYEAQPRVSIGSLAACRATSLA